MGAGAARTVAVEDPPVVWVPAVQVAAYILIALMESQAAAGPALGWTLMVARAAGVAGGAFWEHVLALQCW